MRRALNVPAMRILVFESAKYRLGCGASGQRLWMIFSRGCIVLVPLEGGMFKRITKESFDSRFYGKNPNLDNISTELDWFEATRDGVTVLAVLLRCEIDKDLNAVILARDECRRYRAVQTICSKKTPGEILDGLNDCLDEVFSAHVDGAFPQGDDIRSINIFDHKVPEDRRNEYYKMIEEDPDHYPAKVMIGELAHWFYDSDGVFNRALQGNEFNARLFELYLRALFYCLRFEVIRPGAQPDYCLEKFGNRLFVEATSVAEDPAARAKSLLPGYDDALLRHVKEEMQYKFARTLLNKVKHKPKPDGVPYWELSHVKGNPFAIAIHDYSWPGSMVFSDGALEEYLYGLRWEDGKWKSIDKHVLGGKEVLSNFFGDERHKYVSAVILATQATIPKFDRMGRLAGVDSPNRDAWVAGQRMGGDGRFFEFFEKVGSEGYSESWVDGVIVFHNPKAFYPLSHFLFPGVIHVFGDGMSITRLIPIGFVKNCRVSYFPRKLSTHLCSR